jgi:hypothetical protein
MSLDAVTVDDLCLFLAVAGLLVGVLGAVSIRLAHPLPTATDASKGKRRKHF